MAVGIITGASSGLGFAFARHTARAGEISELWLVARRGDRLASIAAELASEVTVRPIVLDLADAGSFAALGELLALLKPDVRLLVNCAGLGFLGDFGEIPQGDTRAMCDVNVRALTMVTAGVLPYMQRGSIIMASSIASFAPTPRMSVYSATKAYVASLSKGLGVELRPRGINVLAVNPCPMNTEFLSVGRISGKSAAFDRLPRCDPDRVAGTALRLAARGRRAYTPLALFKLYRVIAKILPHRLVMSFTRL